MVGQLLAWLARGSAMVPRATGSGGQQRKMFVLVLVLVVFSSCQSSSRVQGVHLQELKPGQRLPEAVIKTKALEKLMQVFGIRPPNHRERHRIPPQYMIDLYNSIADSSGITKTTNPYDANVIRSFPDRDQFHHMHFHFNLSGVEASEKVLQAEFHLFKMKPSSRPAVINKPRSDDVKSHLLEMRVYQVMDESRINKEDGNRLLDARRLSSYSVGWEVFHVKTAVADWLKNHSSNHGLLVTLRSMSGEPVSANDMSIQVAKRRHHGKKQPILVVFTDDGRPRHPPTFPTADELAEWNLSQEDFSSEDNVWENDLEGETTRTNDPAKNNKRRQTTNENINKTTTNKPPSPPLPQQQEEQEQERQEVGGQEAPPDGQSRRKRSSDDDDAMVEDSSLSSSELQATSTDAYSNFHRTTDCTRDELYVDFEAIGWSSWIISPKGYNAFHCTGQCSFPLGQNQRPTNHATVQSIVHELRLQQDVQTPCCVPNKLFSISLLYFDSNGNVILKQYEDMVAASCGCH